jgi:hypothetical protein
MPACYSLTSQAADPAQATTGRSRSFRLNRLANVTTVKVMLGAVAMGSLAMAAALIRLLANDPIACCR